MTLIRSYCRESDAAVKISNTVTEYGQITVTNLLQILFPEMTATKKARTMFVPVMGTSTKFIRLGYRLVGLFAISTKSPPPTSSSMVAWLLGITVIRSRVLLAP